MLRWRRTLLAVIVCEACARQPRSLLARALLPKRRFTQLIEASASESVCSNEAANGFVSKHITTTAKGYFLCGSGAARLNGEYWPVEFAQRRGYCRAYRQKDGDGVIELSKAAGACAPIDSIVPRPRPPLFDFWEINEGGGFGAFYRVYRACVGDFSTQPEYTNGVRRPAGDAEREVAFKQAPQAFGWTIMPGVSAAPAPMLVEIPGPHVASATCTSCQTGEAAAAVNGVAGVALVNDACVAWCHSTNKCYASSTGTGTTDCRIPPPAPPPTCPPPG